MRLISWNIMQGGGNRIPSIIRALELGESRACYELSAKTEKTGALSLVLYNDDIASFLRT